MSVPRAEAIKPSAKAAEGASPRPASIFHPVLDFLCAGGLSILVLVPLLVSGREDLAPFALPAVVWLLAILNYSHFMASYRIVYRDREMILRHKWASMGIPLILLGYCVLAFWQAQSGQPVLMGILIGVGSAYLAWHYTGQAWGMMASYTYLGGNRFEKGERLLVRGSLRILLVFHVVWFARIWMGQTRLAEPFWLTPLYQAASVAAVLALPLGAIGLGKYWLRAGKLPPSRALVAWLATFVWYAALARWGLPALILLVQPAHALQYIEFPVRVELNRATRAKAARAGMHLAVYLVLLLLVSFVVILLVPGPAMSAISRFLGIPANRIAPVLLLGFINVHHYFTDGVAWKLSNPEVRKDLFAHTKPGPDGSGPGSSTPKKRSPKTR